MSEPESPYSHCNLARLVFSESDTCGTSSNQAPGLIKIMSLFIEEMSMISKYRKNVTSQMAGSQSSRSMLTTLPLMILIFMTLQANRSVLKNTDLLAYGVMTLQVKRSVFFNTDQLAYRVISSYQTSTRISANTWSTVCIGNQLSYTTMFNVGLVIILVIKVSNKNDYQY